MDLTKDNIENKPKMLKLNVKELSISTKEENQKKIDITLDSIENKLKLGWKYIEEHYPESRIECIRNDILRHYNLTHDLSNFQNETSKHVKDAYMANIVASPGLPIRMNRNRIIKYYSNTALH